MSCPEDNTLRACPPAEEGKALSSLYRGALRPLLPLLSSKAASAAGGAAMSTRASAALVPGFIRRAGIDMSDFESREWRSFNDFFTRGLRPGARPVDPDPLALVSPCDSRLLALDITPDLTFRIKGGDYSVSSLLRNRRLAEDFAGGGYNPLILRYGLTEGKLSGEQRTAFAATLDHSVHMMATALELGDFGCWTGILEETVYHALFQVGQAVLDGSFRKRKPREKETGEETV